jgi:hypothetical protein
MRLRGGIGLTKMPRAVIARGHDDDVPAISMPPPRRAATIAQAASTRLHCGTDARFRIIVLVPPDEAPRHIS